ncbi:MAG: hypothetical protein WCC48_00165 [Anaeromyxobacteraceae bacterium]
MTRYESNATVKSGYYFNPITMNVVPVARDGERLPNDKGAWFAIPTVAALALTPLLGALFLMFLPMIGFVLFAQAAGVKAASLFKGGAGELVVPGYAPGMAHLTGKEASGEKKEGEAKAALELQELQKEIDAKRR